MLIARIYYTVSTGAAYTRSTLRKSVLAAGAAQDKGTFGSESNLSVLGKYNTYNHLGLFIRFVDSCDGASARIRYTNYNVLRVFPELIS